MDTQQKNYNLIRAQNFVNYQNGIKLNTNDQSISTTQKSHYLYSVPPPISNNNIPTMSQTLIYNTQSAYNIAMYSQPIYTNQSTYQPGTYNTQYSTESTIPWLTEPCQATQMAAKSKTPHKTTEKYSPHSYSTQLEALGLCSPVLNSDITNYRNRTSAVDSQWYYNSNYNTQNLSSCSEAFLETSNISSNTCCREGTNYIDEKICSAIISESYCSVQKSENVYQNNPDLCSKRSIYENIESELSRLPPCLQESCPSTTNNENFSYCTTSDLNNCLYNDSLKKDKNSQCGGESDIIVEDSDEESSDVSEECNIEESIIYVCSVCNSTSKSNTEIIFFHIGDETLLTSTTQAPVVRKLEEITHNDFPKNICDHICNLCLNLVNTIDCLELKLNDTRKKLIDMYEKTCAVLKEITPPTTITNEQPTSNCIDLPIDVNELTNQSISNLIDIEPKSVTYTNKRICKICNKYFYLNDIHKHKQLHANHINFKCTLCYRSFTMKRLLDSHLRRHSDEREYLCDRCGKNFIKRHSLNIHLRRHYSEFSVFCEICKKGFVTNSTLDIHRRTHTDVKQFQCKICDKKFRTNTNLQEHVRYCSGDLAFECDQCDKKFAAVAKLNDHIKLRHEKKFKITCTECGVGFTKISDHKMHMTRHSDIKPFTCNQCNKSYKTLSNLNHHLIVHGELPFKCDVCKKGFRRKENYQAHKNIHLGLKTFVCNVCDKRFAIQKHLDAHLRIHNGTLKKKTCPVCSKQLTHGLTEHMRLHTGVRPFKCNECSLTFISKCALRKHTKRKHAQSA